MQRNSLRTDLVNDLELYAIALEHLRLAVNSENNWLRKQLNLLPVETYVLPASIRCRFDQHNVSALDQLWRRIKGNLPLEPLRPKQHVPPPEARVRLNRTAPATRTLKTDDLRLSLSCQSDPRVAPLSVRPRNETQQVQTCGKTLPVQSLPEESEFANSTQGVDKNVPLKAQEQKKPILKIDSPTKRKITNLFGSPTPSEKEEDILLSITSPSSVSSSSPPAKKEGKRCRRCPVVDGHSKNCHCR